MSNQLQNYLNPVCSLETLDNYYVRQSILEALKSNLTNFHGTVLDIGCGYMPYKSLLTGAPSRAQKYIGLDLSVNTYMKPDIEWDGKKIPLEDSAVECAIATEVFEHCPDPEIVMNEALRVLKPGGFLFFTVPFLWPLHDVPYDEYRYTPFSLERHLCNSGFADIRLQPLGGWDASLAQMIGLWVRRKPIGPRKRKLMSLLLKPVIQVLISKDKAPEIFEGNSMFPGISGVAKKPLL